MFNQIFVRSLWRWVFLFAVYFLVAASSFSGYFTKWAFLDGDRDPRATMTAMLDGTAHRPFVYRQLIPYAANAIERALPDRIRQPLAEKLAERNTVHKFFSRATDSGNPQYVLRYYVVYWMVFASMLLALFALRAVCLELGGGEVAATLAPMAIAAIFPLLQTNYGTFYDMPELFFLATATWLALRGRIVWLVLLAAVATLNKESFPFFIVALFPFFRHRFSRNASFSIVALLFFVGSIINLLVKFNYSGNPGGAVEFHLIDHLAYLADPRHYFLFEFNYGVLTTKGLNVINLVLIGVLVGSAWGKLAGTVRQHIMIALAINLPLFLVFCANDELRNLSLLYIGLVMVVYTNIAGYLAHARQRTCEPVQVPEPLPEAAHSLRFG